jgi:hypothetical protein
LQSVFRQGGKTTLAKVKREPGANPGLSRSGVQERKPSLALVERLGSDGN